MTDDALPYDQRGAPFGRVFYGNSNGVARIDIGAYELQPRGVPSDYNLDGGVNAADYVMWRKFLSTSVAPTFTGADGDGDSSVDPDDYDVWQENFGETLPGAGSGVSTIFASGAPIALKGEPNGVETSMSFSINIPNQTAESLGTIGADATASRGEYPPIVLDSDASRFALHRPILRGSLSAYRTISASQRDEALVAWLVSHPDTKKLLDDFDAAEMRASEDVDGADDLHLDSVEQVFKQLAST